MNQEPQYQELVKSYYQAIINSETDEYLKKAISLSCNFDDSTVKKAKAEACVLAVADSQFKA